MKKIIGIILIVLGALNIIACMAGFMRGSIPDDRQQAVGKQFIMAIGITGLGIYLLNTAKPKEEEKNNES